MIRLISLVVFVVGLSTSLIAQIYIPPVLERIVLIPVRMNSHAFIFLPRG